MGLIVHFAEHGLIHGDFNEFNIMISPVPKRTSARAAGRYVGRLTLFCGALDGARHRD
jgi:hypothetical protein